MNKIYIIAEAGVNHNGDLNLAYKMIDAAYHSGADAVKFQTFKTEKVISIAAEKAEYQKKNVKDKSESQFEMVKKLELGYEDFKDLKHYCKKIGIEFMTTAFDYQSVDFIDNLVDVYKIPSGELNNLPFIKYIAGKCKPVILSTGMGTLSDVEAAIDSIKENQPSLDYKKFPPLTILHCTTNYPCPYDEVNLKAMLTLQQAFKLPVGYSDHTLGTEIPVAAVALGATVIEKHFTLDRSLPGPDQKSSLEPIELKEMVKAIRNVEKALGDGLKKPNDSEKKIMKVARKSMIAAVDIKAGAKITNKMIAIKRPGDGISPVDVEKIIGLKIKKDKKLDEVLYWEDFKE